MVLGFFFLPWGSMKNSIINFFLRHSKFRLAYPYYHHLSFLFNGGPILKGVLVSSASVMLAWWAAITPCSA